MTDKKKRVPPRDRDGEGVPDPEAVAAMERLLGHRSPLTSGAVYAFPELADRTRVFRPATGRRGAIVEFMVAGRRYAARLPNVALPEGATRTRKARRLVRPARPGERAAKAQLRLELPVADET